MKLNKGKNLKLILGALLSTAFVLVSSVPAFAHAPKQAAQRANDFDVLTYYNIAFDANPESIEKTDDDVTGETVSINKIYKHETKTLTENGFKIWGYKFIEWNTEPDGSGDSYKNKEEVKDLDEKYGIPHDGTLILYAQWYPDMYTVRYDPNTGTGHMDDQHILWIDTTTSMSENLFTKPGFEFIGWSMDPYDDISRYELDSVHYTNTNLKDDKNRYGADPGDTITLYAIWRPLQYEKEDGYYKITGTPGKGGDSFFEHTAESNGVEVENIKIPEERKIPNHEDDKISGSYGETTYSGVYYATDDVIFNNAPNQYKVGLEDKDKELTYKESFALPAPK